MAGFVFYPILITFIYSLQRLNLTKPHEQRFIGLENYRAILASRDFWLAFSNSAFVLVLVVFFSMLGGFIVGWMLSKKTKLSGLLIAFSIIPWALPGIVNGILWRFIFYSGNGLANMILLKSHLVSEPYQWLSNRFVALFIIAFISSWRHIPFCSIVFLAAIQSIPKSTLEAARMDGASKLREIIHIVIPMISSSFKIVFATAVLHAVNVFDEIVALSGYRDLTKTLLVENYLTTFSFLDFGKGSALVYLIMIFSGMIGFLHIKTLSQKGAYDEKTK
ncbi:MAG: sugar ABC transporter permease [Peptostreptococcaceae bacterium]|nr:sugar ABC transporter permease [Peptostreptococcaceae bacterium]